jgi:hypothetical protein
MTKPSPRVRARQPMAIDETVQPMSSSMGPP